MTVYRAIYDNGQTGSLAGVSFSRNNAAVDPFGVGVPANTPRYGLHALSTSFGEWTELVAAGANSYVFHSCGYDRNDSDKMCVYYRQGPHILDFYVNKDIDGVPSFSVDISKDAGAGQPDLLTNSPIEETHYRYHPHGAICLPGCFVFVAEKEYDVNENPADRAWQEVGIALISYQHNADDSWTWAKVGETTGVVSQDNLRCAAWVMCSYFPTSLNQSPLLDVFVACVDYRGNSVATKNGGEAFLIRATRASVDANWSFGTFYLVYSETGKTNTHFHCAAWTPNGYVLAKGDAPAKNECLLFTCSDWDNYDQAGNWTTYVRAHGADDSHGAGETESRACQFIGTVPSGVNLNTVIVQADVMESWAYLMSVPDDPADGLSFTRMGGFHNIDASDDDGSKGWENFYASDSSPHKGQGVVLTGRPDGGTNITDAQVAAGCRVRYSPNGRRCVNIARYHVNSHPTSKQSRYGNDIIFFHETRVAADPRSISSMPVPVTAGPRRPLCVGPASQNRLMQQGGNGSPRTLYNPSTQGTNTITASTEFGPGRGPVYDVVGDKSHATLMEFDFTDGTTIPAGNTWVCLWIKNTTKKAVTLIGTLSGGVYTESYNFRATSRDEWVSYTLRFTTDANFAAATPHFKITTGGTAYPAEFSIDVAGIYKQDTLPYQVTAGVTGNKEVVSQALPSISSTTYTVGLELTVPYNGSDWWHRTVIATHAIATIWFDATNYVEITIDYANEEIDFDIVKAGVSQAILTLSEFHVQRGDNILIAVAFDTAAPLTSVYAICGGVTNNGVQSDSHAEVPTGSPVEVRFGDNDQTNIPTIDVLSVAYDPLVEHDKAGILDMMSPTEVTGAGSGGGYAAASHFNLVQPKMI